MDPVVATPTESQDYVALSVTYAALAATVALLASRRRHDPAPTQPAELVL